MKLKVGDKVKLNKNIKKFEYGRAGVGYNEIGIITWIREDGYILVGFPETMQSWGGLEHELVLVNRKKFFKNLPNDFTGIIEVKNGYIVEKEILDEVEKEYLSNIIKPFREKVRCIMKVTSWSCLGKEYIKIILIEEGMGLPYFEKGFMYKGMEEEKEYTLEELGL